MATTKWTFDPVHSELTFKIKHLMISNVTGSFGKFDVTTDADSDDFTKANVEVKVDVTSINTNNKDRDGHLLAGDFFETEKYPEITFKSTRVEKLDEDTFNLYGDLTIKGVTKPVKLSVEHSGGLVKDPWGNIRTGFTIEGKINRKDFGMNFNSVLETGGLMLGDDVKISGEIELIKTVEQEA